MDQIGYSIIIPNFNGEKFLAKCLSSLYLALDNSKLASVEIIFVDNGSSDNSIELLKKFRRYPLLILKNKINKGFAFAVNQGIRASKYNYTILLNNDLYLDKNWLKIMHYHILHRHSPTISCFFGLVLNYSGTYIESTGLRYFSKGKAVNLNNQRKYTQNLQKYFQNKKPYKIWGASASLVVYQRDVFKKVGYFDEDFFAYQEDVDLAYRLSKNKYDTIFVPQAVSFHLGGGTSSKMGVFRQTMDVKNWWLLIIKNYSIGKFIFNFPSILIERLKNISGLLKACLSTYKFKTLYLFPYLLTTIFFKVLRYFLKYNFSFLYDHRH